MKKKQIAPYRICIHTDGYTGNFERELIGFCLGVLDELTEEYLSPTETRDYCKHFFYEQVMNRSEKQYYLDLSDSFNKQTGYDDIMEVSDHPLLKDYLLETYQNVDDWEQFTFYYIGKYFKDKDWNCNSLYIQLEKPLDEIWEEIVLKRIVDFFTNSEEKNYELLNYTELDNISLLSVELINENNEVIKEYNLKDYNTKIEKDYFSLTLPQWN